MIERYVWRDGQFVNKSTGLPMDIPDGPVCAPLIQSDIAGYMSMATGKYVDGRSAQRDDLARSGCRIMDPDEGPKTCRTEKWARRLGMEHDPNAGRPKHRPKQ
jgi:hypothetical protein